MFTLPEKREKFLFTLNWQFPINDNSGSLVDLESMKFCHVYFTFSYEIAVAFYEMQYKNVNSLRWIFSKLLEGV